MEDIPDEMWQNVMVFLGYDSICKLALVSTQHYRIYTSTKLWSYLVGFWYPHAYKVIISMLDIEFCFDMWFYFYEHITCAINKGANSTYFRTGHVGHASLFGAPAIQLLLYDNDKEYIPDLQELAKFTNNYYCYNQAQVLHILNVKKIRNRINCYYLAEKSADRYLIDLSIHIYMNYLSETEKKMYYSKYRNSTSINTILDPSSEYTPIEYIDELYTSVDNCKGAISQNYYLTLMNKVSGKYLANKVISVLIIILENNVYYGIFITRTLVAIQFKFMIQEFLKTAYRIDIIESKFEKMSVGNCSIKYSLPYNLREDVWKIIKQNIEDHISEVKNIIASIDDNTIYLDVNL